MAYSLALMATLFAGPVLQSLMDPEDSFSISLDLKSMRNLVFAPITEEVVYRASILPIQNVIKVQNTNAGYIFFCIEIHDAKCTFTGLKNIYI